MTGLHELLETSFMREALAKAKAERQAQVIWFTCLLNSLNAGDIESCREGIQGAIDLLEKGESIQWQENDHGNE